MIAPSAIHRARPTLPLWWRRLLWRWRRARARRYLWTVDVNYRRDPTPVNRAVLARAARYARQLELSAP